MNSSNFLRLLTTTSKYCTKVKYVKTQRITSPLNSRMMATKSIEKSKEKETFQNALPIVIDTLVSSPLLAEVPDVARWTKRLLEYNFHGGKKMRGMMAVYAYEMLEKPENITEESMQLARIMGWCLELLQAYFMVADDMMDGSTTRRGAPCWYRLPEVGLEAINDVVLMNSLLFLALNTHFRTNPQYTEIVNLFNETVLLTSAGQHMDFMIAQKKKEYSLFTIERYEAVVKYKTSFYSFRLPVTLGMLLANITDKDARAKVDDICFDFGRLFQMQDDYMDCFVDESLTGKVGTDIQEGKCSWVSATALRHCSEEQRAVFYKHYASKRPEDVQAIKQLYDQLGLPQLYKDEERARYEAIISKIDALRGDPYLQPNLFLNLLDKLYSRKG